MIRQIKKAFTLIELLIVVAIIAILAAIAVPNYLQAQTRARVAALMSDMRTVANSLDFYYQDYNAYINWRWPLPANKRMDGGGYFFIESLSGQKSGIGWMLTTPVAYITNIPYDHFWNTVSERYYGIAQATILMVLAQGGFGYTIPLIPRNRYDFFLTSPGPNHLHYCYDPSSIYDPTNGAVSNGDISFLHPIGFAGGPGNIWAGFDGAPCAPPPR